MYLVLYGTLGCHLCDLAQPIVINAATLKNVDVFYEDIAESEDSKKLIELFGEKIPVLLHEVTGRMISWPFDYNDVVQFIDDISE